MNHRFLASVFALLAVTFFSGCEALKAKGSQTSRIERSEGIHFTMDPELTTEERELLSSDINKASQFQVQVEPKSFYGIAFGSGDASGAIRYLSERVHYVLPASVNLDSRIVFHQELSSFVGQNDFAGLYMMAMNVGTALWLQATQIAPHQIGFQMGNQVIPLTSSRVGIIQLGQGYTLKHNGEYAFPELARITTLIHEARHSDCTGGLIRSDLEKIEAGEIPEHHSCGHLHVRCPEGHDYEGAFACDADAWGAYSIEALYSAAMVKNCTNCTSEEQKLALMIFADSYSRVIPANDMLQGKLGLPDMSSSNKIHD